MPTATELFSQFLTKEGSARENVVKQLLDSWSLPGWWWVFQPVEVQQGEYKLVYFVSPDYITFGDHEDWLPCPMTPVACREWLAQHNFCLPTKKMVNQIWEKATIKGRHPISYSSLYKGVERKPKRGSTRVYIDQGRAVQAQLKANYPDFSPGMLVAGHKKDVVLSDYLSNPKNEGKVAIYGWFDGKSGEVVQGLNAVDHSINYVDYSHGVRAIQQKCFLNGVETTLNKIWSDASTCSLIHDSPLRFQKY